ncbi:MAG: ABC transporter permease [Nitrospinota bacterium]
MATTSPPLAPPRIVPSARWRRFAKEGGLELMLLIGLILSIWATISALIPNPERYLPAPLTVIFSSSDMLWKGLLPNYLGQTIWRLVLGSILGLSLGIPFGILLGLNRTVSDIFYPILNFFQSISGIAILPIIVVWWGNSEKTVFTVILYTAMFPITFNVLAGVRSIPRIYINMLRSLGASRYQVARDVILPGAMPYIATGARLGIAFAWRAVIAGEMLVGKRGLGWMIFTAQDTDHTDEVILGMVMIGVIWILIDRFALRPIEADTIQRWGLVQR